MAAAWDQLLAPGRSNRNSGTRFREFTRTEPNECVWDIDVYGLSEDQVRRGGRGGARIAGFGDLPDPIAPALYTGAASALARR